MPENLQEVWTNVHLARALLTLCPGSAHPPSPPPAGRVAPVLGLLSNALPFGKPKGGLGAPAPSVPTCNPTHCKYLFTCVLPARARAVSQTILFIVIDLENAVMLEE